jgi:hypothetical protein
VIPPFCACDCGNKVTWHKAKKCWNIFISGHNKGRLGKGKPKLPSQLCECGCGQMTKPGNRFIFCHHHTGENSPSKRPEVKAKIGKANSIALLGNKQSEETRLKRIKPLKGKARKNVVKANKTLERRKIASKNLIRLWEDIEYRTMMIENHSGENHYNWQGGISKEPYSQDWTKELKEQIRERDNYQCQICFISEDLLKDNYHKKLTIHHIDYDKKNCSPDNLISLCGSCHTKTNYNRDEWINKWGI